MKIFDRPFYIEPPIPLESLGEGDEKYAKDTWEVCDINGCTISTHKTEEAAKEGLRAAETNVPRVERKKT